MKKIFCISILICICFAGCGDVSQQASTFISQPADCQVDEEKNSEIPNDLNITISELNRKISLYLETEYKMSNFEVLDKELISLPNSIIPYKVYFLGDCGQDSGDQYLIVKLHLEKKQYTTEPNVSLKLSVTGEIAHDTIPGDSFENFINDPTLKPICEGTFEVGEPYEPKFHDFDGKEQIVADMKSAVRSRYFTEPPDSVDEPIFYHTTKAKEVYILDFDEGCWTYGKFCMIVYTEDGYVYLAPLWYSVYDKKFYCDEMVISDIRSYKVKDLECAQEGEEKEVNDYCERLKKYAICKLTWENN